MEFPAASQRLYGEVTYKTVGAGAICSVFAWLGVHALVCVFLFSEAGFLGRTVSALHSVLLVKRTYLQTDIAHMMSDVFLAAQNRKRQLNPGFYHFLISLKPERSIDPLIPDQSQSMLPASFLFNRNGPKSVYCQIKQRHSRTE